MPVLFFFETSPIRECKVRPSGTNTPLSPHKSFFWGDSWLNCVIYFLYLYEYKL